MLQGIPVNANVGLAMSIAGAAAFAAAVIYVGVAGVPGGSSGGSSPNQQQVSGAQPKETQSTFGNNGTRETTGYGAPSGARPPRE